MYILFWMLGSFHFLSTADFTFWCCACIIFNLGHFYFQHWVCFIFTLGHVYFLTLDVSFLIIDAYYLNVGTFLFNLGKFNFQCLVNTISNNGTFYFWCCVNLLIMLGIIHFYWRLHFIFNVGDILLIIIVTFLLFFKMGILYLLILGTMYLWRPVHLIS